MLWNIGTKFSRIRERIFISVSNFRRYEESFWNVWFSYLNSYVKLGRSLIERALLLRIINCCATYPAIQLVSLFLLFFSVSHVSENCLRIDLKPQNIVLLTSWSNKGLISKTEKVSKFLLFLNPPPPKIGP